jgi:hypothetical protein
MLAYIKNMRIAEQLQLRVLFALVILQDSKCLRLGRLI